MIKAILPALVVALLAPGTAVCASAQDGAPAPEPQAALTDEALLLEDMPVVFTAAKKEQLASEAPSSITVITAEDIRRSGANSIPEALRFVVGLDVFQETATSWQVNARGLNAALNPRMLVLVDGRTVYQDLYGGTTWYLLPVVLEDIERIEVVRGPGSSLYGANAFSGVINIITKSVQAAAGTNLAEERGGNDLQHHAVIYGDPAARVPYKFVAGYDSVEEWNSEALSGRSGKLNLLAQPSLAGRQQLSLAAGYQGGIADVRYTATTRRPLGWDEHSSYLMATYERPGFCSRAFWNHADAHVWYPPDPVPGSVDQDVLDLETQINRTWGRHGVILGADVRRTRVKAEITSGYEHSEDLLSVFAHDEYRAGRRLTLVGGARYDHTDLLGGRVSPRFSALYHLGRGQLLRASYGRAFRRPTFLESYIYRPRTIMPGVDLILHGNPDLDPEVLDSYELEYRLQPNRRVHATVEVYRYRLDGFILDRIVGYLPPPLPPIPVEGTLVNALDLRATGLEVAGEYVFSSCLSAFANAAWERVVDRATDQELDVAPAQIYNAGLRYTSPRGLLADLYFQHKASSRGLLSYDSDDPPCDEFTLVNARLAQTLKAGDLELAVSVFNLFDERHQEYIDSPVVGRRVSVSAHYRY